ncbi:S8 family peptidase [Actinomadura rudentiformis]|uniref:S8 family serine peptidase n=1 Tax=Actinomadura rudentiformis TaxID=359158 RepID=A0A6H9YYP0_9ACTN|nr:S8 family serine peptidase [Actinomadura rudentiformis]KAB2349454.1 S8 family serine peptidase [Actinomadura rudentiformis]
MASIRRPHRKWRAVFGAAVAITLPLTLAAAPPSGAAPAGAAAPKSRPAPSGKTVSLITGDTVLYGKERDSVVLLKGRPGISYSVTRNGADRYVVPSDAQPLVTAKQVDKELFNLTRLVNEGLAGAGKPLPVIVSYGKKGTRLSSGTLQSRADALPGSTPGRVLDTVDAVALKVDRTKPGALWSALAPARTSARPGLKANAQRLFLDVRVRATLDQSVPQVGAPQAWQAGFDGKDVKVAVLDTGIQAHPDTNGTSIAWKSFVPGEPSILDEHGHGTHVASTITSQGKGSTPARKGVAPGAKLIIGKVLGKDGSGQLSGIIDAMRWATEENKADIVSMSLGATPSATTEILDQAVNDLSRSTGALFVIAAGNSGSNARTLDSPGTADEALTVAAVDKGDRLAAFSSRGPRKTDGALKPDIAAPGVDIVAARASGTSMGAPVDDLYTSASGTSMATPHVAGAAAILKQRHPTWKGPQLKAALIASAKDVGAGSFQVGSGRLQAGKVIEQTVTADPPSLSFGKLAPDQAQEVSKTITYGNTGTTPVTLDLAAAVNGPDGKPLPADSARLSTSSLTIAAGQTGQATLTLKIAAGARGLYTGAVTATAGAQAVRTAVGLEQTGPLRKVTFQTFDRDGTPLDSVPRTLTVGSNDDPTQDWTEYLLTGGGTLELPAGSYTFVLEGPATDAHARSGIKPESMLAVQPQVEVRDDTTVTFDARQMRPINVTTPATGYDAAATVNWVRAPRAVPKQDGAVIYYRPTKVHVLPTPQPVTDGTFTTGFMSQRIAPQVVLEVGQTRIEARYLAHDRERTSALNPKLEMFPAGIGDVTMVYAGDGSAAELAKVPVQGNLVLIQRDTYNVEEGQALGQRLADAGAKGAIVFDSRDGYETGIEVLYGGEKAVVAGVTRADGLRLQQAIGSRPTQVRLSSQPRPGWVYNPAKYWRGQVPADPSITMTPGTMTVVETHYPTAEDRLYLTANSAWPHDHVQGLFTASLSSWAPVRRLEAFPVDSDLRWQRMVIPDGDKAWFFSPTWSRWDVFTGSTARKESRARTPIRLGQLARTNQPAPGLGGPGLTPLFAARRGNTLYPAPHLVSGEGHTEFMHPLLLEDLLPWPDGKVVTSTLTRDGTEVPGRKEGPVTVYDLPETSARYDLRLVYTSELLGYEGYKVDTTWGFTSGKPSAPNVPAGYVCGDGKADCAPTPALLLDYDIPLDLTNKAAPGAFTMTISSHHQPGAPDPNLSGLQASISYDGGTTWQQITTTRKDAKSFTANTTLPASKTVSLRFQAQDTDGNTVNQTFHQAFTTRS